MVGYPESGSRRLGRQVWWREVVAWFGAKRGLGRGLALLLLAGVLIADARAAIQFDVFLGYDGIVPEACWFPIVCEVKNDAPTFTGTIEITPGNLNQSQVRRLTVELPTGTLKRLVIPVFASTRGFSRWDVRLLDERGRNRAEQTGLQPRKEIGRGVPLVGALPRTPSGAPQLRPVLSQQAELQPATARLLPTLFPDNPLVLEGLTCVYLNSEKAAELGKNQVMALQAWMHAGGHLVVAVEQPTDIFASQWLKTILPCEIKDLHPLPRHPELQTWLTSATWNTNLVGRQRQPSPGPSRPGRTTATARPSINLDNPFSDLTDDPAFEAAEMQVAAATLRDGQIVVASGESGDTPLIIGAPRGRGRLTVLLFSPEREPFRSWKNLPTFWAKLAEVPGVLYVSNDYAQQGGWSSDGIFGAMIDTRQVHKLPVGWLLLLLIIYLAVIGPIDQYWLKRIRRPMLTWVTFPCYVVLFSLLIYFIGYKLRAGESEWNELHIVDVLLRGEAAELRGRTYASVYSPSNQRFLLGSQLQASTLRGEFAGLWSGGENTEKATVDQVGDNFKAEIFVPVWTSQLYVSDWWQPSPMPFETRITPEGAGWRVKVTNHTDRKLTNAHVAIGAYIFRLGDIAAGETGSFQTTPAQGRPLRDFVWQQASGFQNAVSSRRRAFGAAERGQISDLQSSSMAVSFLTSGRQQGYMDNFITPPGLDLSPVLDRGQAVLLTWADDYAPVKKLYSFTPRRGHKQTLWRMAVEVTRDQPRPTATPEA